MYIHQPSVIAAQTAAEFIRHKLGIDEISTAVVLGTGLGNNISLDKTNHFPFSYIPGLESIRAMNGHARLLDSGYLNGKPLLVLRGRIHLNEAPADPKLPKAVRLQIEMLAHLGVQNLILTCAAGSLTSQSGGFPLRVGDVMQVDGFITLFAPDMPLFAGEFCSPEDTLVPELRQLASEAYKPTNGRLWRQGGYVMLRGPQFEGRRYDKQMLAETGAKAVGMSLLPEACVAALYNINVLALAFITNDNQEEHSHETNQRRLVELKEDNSHLLTSVVTAVANYSFIPA